MREDTEPFAIPQVFSFNVAQHIPEAVAAAIPVIPPEPPDLNGDYMTNDNEAEPALKIGNALDVGTTDTAILSTNMEEETPQPLSM